MSEATPDPYDLTLALHDYDCPCFMQLMDPSCPERAAWIIHFEHAVTREGEEAGGCGLHPTPLCHAHKNLMQATFTGGFWSMWLGTGDTRCVGCGRPLQIKSIDPIRKG